MIPLSIEEKLAVNKYDIDREIHVRLDEQVCRDCPRHSCLTICPAGCFKQSGDRIVFSFEGCLECGSCRLICNRGALDWTTPRPGFGICYEYG